MNLQVTKIPSKKYIVALTVVVALLCFFNLGKHTLTLDEVASIMISRNWESLKYFLMYEEGNMWLYYLLLHFWLRFGETEFWVRGLSVIAGALTVPFVYKLGHELKGKKTAQLATVLFSLNLYFVAYARQARGYSLALLFITISSYAYFRFLKSRTSNIYLLIYVLSTVLAFYSYILVALVIVVQFVMLLIVPKPAPWKRMLIAGVFVGICMIPLFSASSFRSHQVDWIQKPDIVSLIYGFIVLCGDSIVVTVVSGVVVLAYLWEHRSMIQKRDWDRFITVWLLAWAIFPTLFGFFFALLVKPIYEPESFNTSLPGFIILLATSLKYLYHKQKYIYYCATAIIILFLSLRLGSWYLESSGLHYAFENKSSRDWKAAVEYIDTRAVDGDAIVYYAYYVKYPFEYYLQKNPPKGALMEVEVSSKPYAIGGGTLLPKPDIQKVDRLKTKYNRVWLVLSYNEFNWLDRKKQSGKIEHEISEHFNLKSDKKFDMLEVKLYENKKSKN